MAENFKNTVKGNILSYSEYIRWVEQLVSEGKTSGHKQTEALAGFTALNLKRMQRIDKTLHLSKELKEAVKELEEHQDWWVITEAWCGDSAQNLPVIARIAQESNGKIDLHIIFRDDNPELMNRYLTNGSKSIPKLIAFDKEDQELFTWGPRPKQAQQLLLDWKANPNGRNWDDFEKELHTWYAKDKAQAIQKEFSSLMAYPVLKKRIMAELIFIYNAGSGLFNAMSDFAHKIFSPSTYSCSLCMLTYGNAGMKKEWHTFLESLPYKKTFLHKDEVQKASIKPPKELPVILLKDEQGEIQQLVSATELNQLQSLNELILFLQKRLKSHAEN